jgi:hypothetical protein
MIMACLLVYSVRLKLFTVYDTTFDPDKLHNFLLLS